MTVGILKIDAIGEPILCNCIWHHVCGNYFVASGSLDSHQLYDVDFNPPYHPVEHVIYRGILYFCRLKKHYGICCHLSHSLGYLVVFSQSVNVLHTVFHLISLSLKKPFDLETRAGRSLTLASPCLSPWILFVKR